MDKRRFLSKKLGWEKPSQPLNWINWS